MKQTAFAFALSAALLGLLGVSRAQNSAVTAPDNSAVNTRDRAPGSMTADQQSNAKGDVELTRRIRRAVVKDSSLSVLAHNVKIISSNGSVTLRGPVKTEGEKVAIASKAKAIAGVGNVNDQLEVKGQ